VVYALHLGLPLVAPVVTSPLMWDQVMLALEELCASQQDPHLVVSVVTSLLHPVTVHPVEVPSVSARAPVPHLVPLVVTSACQWVTPTMPVVGL
jgi:hypothetical protein